MMRKLVLNFRSLVRVGKLASLRLWMKCAQKSGIHALTRSVRMSLFVIKFFLKLGASWQEAER